MCEPVLSVKEAISPSVRDTFASLGGLAISFRGMGSWTVPAHRAVFLSLIAPIQVANLRI